MEFEQQLLGLLEKKILTVSKAAELSNVSRPTIYAWLEKDKALSSSKREVIVAKLAEQLGLTAPQPDKIEEPSLEKQVFSSMSDMSVEDRLTLLSNWDAKSRAVLEQLVSEARKNPKVLDSAKTQVEDHRYDQERTAHYYDELYKRAGL